MGCKFLRMRAKSYGPAPKTIEKTRLLDRFSVHPLFPPGKDQTPMIVPPDNKWTAGDIFEFWLVTDTVEKLGK